MNLIETIQKDKINAMKEKDSFRKDVLSYVFSEAQKRSLERNSKEPTDEEIISVIKKLVAADKEILAMEISEAETNNRQKEIAILEEYLPKMLMEGELKFIIKDFVDSIPVDERKKSMGIIMKLLKENYAGQYDGKMASEIIKAIL